jgi:hypothetical protein
MRKFVFLLFLTLLAAVVMWGAPVCVNGTLADYESLSSGCTIDGVTFSMFDFASAGSVAPLPVAADVTVEVVDGTTPGFAFIGPFAAGAGFSMDVMISYVVNAPSITGQSLSMQAFGQTGNGSVQAVESICEGTLSMGGSCSGPVASLNVFDNTGGVQSFDSVTFASVSSIAVSKAIMVLGGTAGTVSSAGVSTVFDEAGSAEVVPEPYPLITLGSGLILTALLVRKRSRKI